MAYFVRSGGVDGAVKAVTAALSMMDAAERHIDPLFLSEGVQPFAFRVTIDRGSLTMANVGRKIGFSGILAIGTTANMASKMLSVAPPMSIVLGTNVLPYLPEAWLQYAHLLTDNWGWTDQTGQPYRLWEYKGRWVDPPRPAGGFFGAGY
jgi:class 3 adenylate cyclase